MPGFTDIDVESSGDYIKLTAGNPVTFHILSESPKKEKIHWINKKKSTCFGEDCQACAQGDRAKSRWTADVWDRKEGAVKKFEFGSMIASQLKSIAEMLAESQQTIHGVDIRIKTTGSSLETEYSVLHVPMVGIIPSEVIDKYSVPF